MTRTLQTLPEDWRSFLSLAGYDLVCEVDREGRYLALSESYATCRGFRPEDLVGHTPFELGLIHPDDVEGLSERFRPLFEEDRLVRAEYRYRDAAGNWQWVESTGNAFLGPDGGWRCFFISRDISDRKAMEASVAASEANYRAIMEHAVDAILLGNSRGQIIDANTQACQLTAYGRDELLAMHISRLFDPEELQRVPLRFDLLDRGLTVRSRRSITRRDGQHVRIEMHTRKLPDGRYQAFIRDMTEQHAAEDALRRSEERYRLLVDHAPFGIFQFDNDGSLQLCNDTCARQLGRPVEALVGLDMLHGVEDEQVSRAVREALAGGSGLYEGEFRRPDGRISMLRLHTHGVAAADGRPLGGIGVLEETTAQRMAESMLEKESRFLEDIITHNPMSIQLLDLEGYTLKVNPSHTRLFRAVPPPDYTLFRDPLLEQQGLMPLIERGRRGEVVFFPEFRHNPHEIYPEFPDTPVWIRMVMFPILDQEGRPERFVLMHEDVTAQRQAERDLAKAQGLLIAAIEQSPSGILVADAPDVRVRYANHAAIDLLGTHGAREVPAGDEAPPVAWEAFELDGVTPFPEPCMPLSRAVQEGAPSRNVEIVVRRQGGEDRIVSVNAAPVLDAQGRVEAGIAVFHDITESKRMERALRESEDRFRTLYLNTTDSIFWVGVEPGDTFRYEGANPAHETLTGIPGERIAGRTPHECLDPALADAVVANYRRCLATGHPITYAQHFVVGSRSLDLETLLVPIRDEGGRIYRMVGTSRDVTQAKVAEEALRQTQKLESLGVLAGGIAHDFNNLLTAILGNLNLAQLKLASESPALPHLESVEKIVLKASDLTRQMLAYSGKGRFVVRDHNLNDVVQELAHLLHVSISKKIALSVRLAPDLVPIEADGAQIQQVIMNLVTNASDAIGDREGTIGIATAIRDLGEEDIAGAFGRQRLRPGRYATLEVSDTGCGIPPEVLDRIFDPFFSTKAAGRGLGLSAMLGILRGHGAGYTIYSEVGKGTVFRIFFPAATPAESLAPAPPAVEERELRGRVLLVDDEPSILETLRSTLEFLGLHVLTARDGHEAVEVFRREPDAFDLVLMDLTMPRMDGREAFLALRRLRPDVKVLLSSGYNEQESIREFLGQGLAGFIQKPYQVKELRRVIARILGSSPAGI